MSKNFCPLISHLIREVSKFNAFGGVGMMALDYYGQMEGKVDKGKVEGYVELLKQAGMFAPSEPLSCGLTANAFCYVFMDKRMPGNQCDLATLKELIADRKQRLIRIDLMGHSYVIEQIDTTVRWAEPIGNVYQSNIAVIGGGDRVGINLQEYLDGQTNPVKLNAYFDEMERLTSGDAPVDERVDLYKKLYTTPGYRSNPLADEITQGSFQAKAASVAIRRLSYDSINERHVLKAVNAILVAYGNLSGANQARDIYFTRCWS